MSEQNIDVTRPISSGPPPQNVDIGRIKPPKKQKSPRRWLSVLLGILIVIIIAGVGSWFGYNNSIQQRQSKEKGQVALAAATQFQLGLQDQAAGRYEMARQRFEYVIKIDSKFPGVVQKLTEVMMMIATRSIPTEAPLPTMVPTRDMRGVEEIYANIQSLMRNQDWDNAILSIDALRGNDITFHAVDLDGFYYEALRQRGVKKILNGSLEGGIYDLALSERFGPLDKDAESYRNWARLYMTGVSFWDLDWTQVLDYFGQIYPNLPNLRDSANMTAIERYRQAAIHLGETSVVNEDWCTGRDYYKMAMDAVQDPRIAPTATRVAYVCAPPPTATKKAKKTTEAPPDAPTEEATIEPPPAENITPNP